MTKRTAERPRGIAECVGAFLRERDMEGIVSMFHSDCLIFFPPEGPPLVGHEGVRRSFETFLQAPPTLESEVLTEVIIGDIALLRASWRLVDQDGSTLAEGKSTEVAKRFEHGGWGYLIDCPNGPPTL